MMQAEAVEFIAHQGTQGDRKPYFLYLPLPSPHTPWVPTREYVGKSDVELYGDFVMQVDGVVDAVLRSISRIGARENTLVIITSDNGACWYEADDQRIGHDASGGYRGMKGDAHEGGHRMPTIVRWPDRIGAGQVSAALTCHADFFATIAGFLDLRIPHNAALDSIDFSKTWTTASDEGPRTDFVEQAARNNTLSIRRGAWKLIPLLGSAGFSQPAIVKPSNGQPEGQLYQLANDPYETTNVYSKHPDVVVELSALLASRRESERTRSAQ